ncbi:ORF3 [Torque teno felis virus 2]|uniref:ORF3 n=1 Tax=Torque teno felis virus 2 TaxID=2065043 RepID=A8DMP8_9VIRU|nr:ORF3 [Torque teno felis virus 2]ABU55882.1 ORF3 [Torque teno felis virus 2]
MKTFLPLLAGTGVLFFPLSMVTTQKPVYFLNTNYSLSLSEMQYGDRCRETISKMASLTSPRVPLPAVRLTPQPLIKRPEKESVGQRLKQISGILTSTPMESSQAPLIEELLMIIQDLSDANWKTSNDLDLSMTESSMSSQSSTSSSDWELTPPPPPPQGGIKPLKASEKTKHLRFTPFVKTIQ